MTDLDLNAYGECDGCGEERTLAVTESGRYCRECIPPEDLQRLLDDLATTSDE